MNVPMPSFPEFYRAVNDRDPFPWQVRLADCVARTEQWPKEIGVPTGLGKTVCLEIAVWWLASQANRAPVERTAPTRIWWVVNRRLLVDSTTEHAEKLANLLNGCSSAGISAHNQLILAQVANRLRSLCADPEMLPLEVISLRGGISSRTPLDPSQPAVILCTLPMYGSRLLFRGYGSRLRPVDAAMAGTDSLVLLDEAHLVPHLKSLVDALADCMSHSHLPLNGQRSTVTLVGLTATGTSDKKLRFDLDDADYKNREIRKRLDAVKLLELRHVKLQDPARHLSDATLDLMRRASAPSTFLVFANTPKNARAVFDLLSKATANMDPEVNLLLLTGLTREREANRIRAQILDPEHGMAAVRPNQDRNRRLVVIATQTLEVGADIDAEYLVTEACGVRALTQRLGRLNRLGKYSHTCAIYIHLPPPKSHSGTGKEEKYWPVYGNEPTLVLERLESARQNSDETINLSPRLVAGILGPPGEDSGRAPEVLPGILWEWVKTTTPPEGEAPVEPYFNGIASPRYTISAIWRTYVPQLNERLWPRPTDREAVDISIREFQKALSDDVICRLAGDGVTTEEVPVAELRSGERVVLPTDRGLLDRFGWNIASTDPVVDMSLAQSGLPLDSKAIKRLCGINLAESVRKALGNSTDELDEMDDIEREQVAHDIVEAIQDAEPPKGWDPVEWYEFTSSLEPRIVQARREVPRLKVSNPKRETRIEEFDEMSLGNLATLDGHGKAVGVRAKAVAERIGLPANLVEVIELAGRLHDIGKADRRFQLWLDPKCEGGSLMAKSNTPRHQWNAMRVSAGWPRGGRHEDLSARLVRAWLNEKPHWGESIDRDLLVHLVISHHGKGRPLVPPVEDGTQETIQRVVSGTCVEVSADLAEVDWNQPTRFRRLNDHFGPWGLALMEAIVRRSDHAVSAEGVKDQSVP